MRLIDLRHLSGPNIFTSRPVTVARLELDDLTGQETTDCTRVRRPADRACCPGWPSITAPPGGRAGSWTRWRAAPTSATSPSTSRSSCPAWPAGTSTSAAPMWAGADGRYDVMMECPQDEPADSPVPGTCCGWPCALVTDVLAERAPTFDADLDAIARLVERTGPRREHCRARRGGAAAGHPGPAGRRLSLLRLGYGCHRRLVWAALTEQTSAVGVDIAATSCWPSSCSPTPGSRSRREWPRGRREAAEALDPARPAGGGQAAERQPGRRTSPSA